MKLRPDFQYLNPQSHLITCKCFFCKKKKCMKWEQEKSLCRYSIEGSQRWSELNDVQENTA
jgi:hypothetical protein